MTYLDRILISVARRALARLAPRFDMPKGMVWYLNFTTHRPHRRPSGDLVPEAGEFMLGFGEPRNLVAIRLTREMLELLHNGLTDTLAQQAAQYAIVRDERR